MKSRRTVQLFVPLLLAAIFLLSPDRRSFSQSSPEAHGSHAPIQPAAAQKLILSGLPNAGKVNDFLFRGGQPKPEGIAELKKLGISLVVDLRMKGGSVDSEQKRVEAQGMRFVNIPAGNFRGPTHEQIAQFLKLLRDNPGQKIFVHCNLGNDRTGVMIAAYRMAEQHWTPKQARDEMRAFHFHRQLLPSMNRTVARFPESFASNPAYAPLRCAPSASC